MSDTVITVEGLGKKYRIRHQAEGRRYVALRDVIAQKIKAPFHFLRRSQKSEVRSQNPASGHSSLVTRHSSEDFWALKDVSFEVKQGEVLGIIGRNGAGKSTLLKILSRITEPTEGRARIKGRVASLLEVGTGFHPELTGRENIFLNGAILGMTRAEIKKKFDEIVAFAEVEKFLDTPVKRYSSGMYVRLAFAVAAHLEPEILIVDEVLAVGDAQFQKKCLGKMQDVSTKEGRTVLFVSHNMAAVKKLCGRGLLFAGGKIESAGPMEQVVERYLSSGSQTERIISWELELAPKSSEFIMHSIRLADGNGDTSLPLTTAKPLVVEIEYTVLVAIRNLRIVLVMQTTDGIELFESSDFLESAANNPRSPGRYVSAAAIPAHLLNAGAYLLSVGAEIPNEKELIHRCTVRFAIEELACNQMGISLHGKPPGALHPRLEWSVRLRNGKPLQILS
jgi:lipopolysaccharide transport system ATP-binding protein